MLVVFVLVVLLSSIFVPDFTNWANINGLLLSVTTVGMIACTMMLCLASGDFDLSVGSTVAFTGVLCAKIINDTHSVALGVAVGLLAGAIVGILNGTVIAWIGINALITTLATMQIVRGVGFLVSDGKAIGVTDTSFYPIGRMTLGQLLHIDKATENTPILGSILNDFTMPIWIAVVCFIVFGIILNKTTFGRNILAIGGNKEASRLAGIPVIKTQIAIFALQGLVAGLAGVILAARMTSGQPNTSQGLELQVISACVLGGVSLTGGVATISGVVIGVLIMGIVKNVMDLKNLATFWQLVAMGVILLAAVMFDKLRQRKSV